MIATRSNGWIGVDIGTRTVKLAQVVCDQQGFRVVDAAIVPRREPWSAENISPQRPLSSRAEILTAKSIATRSIGHVAACCATTSLCSMASIPVDPETQTPDPEELTQTLVLPDNSQAIVDFCMASNPPRDMSDAIVFAISEPWSEQLATDVHGAGFRCQAIDAIPLALARATVVDSSTPRNRCVATIDLGYSSTTFVVARDGEPCFVRSMDRCRLRGFGDVLMKELDVDHGQAERLLMHVGISQTATVTAPNASTAPSAPGTSIEDDTKTPTTSGMPTTTVGSLKEILGPSLHDLVAEIKRTFMYLQTHQATRVPTEIKLVGGGACIPGIAEMLTETLGIPVSVWHPSHDVAEVNETILPLLAPAIAVSMLPWEARL